MDTWYEQYKTANSYWTIGQVYMDENKIAYDVDLLIKVTKNHEVFEVDVDELKSQLENNAWGLGRSVLSPKDVLNNPDKNKENKKHFKRIKKANLEKPILIREMDGEVIDGYHRLSRALLENKSITSRKVTENDLKQVKLTNFAR